MREPLIRSRQLRMRAIDEAKRTATFVATTEAPCATWMGPEVVRMSGLNLDRFLANPVILDAHNRDEACCVIGRAISLRKDMVAVGATASPDASAATPGASATGGARMIPGLICEIEFAESEEALAIWDLVRTGFLRAVSIGFMPLKYMELEPGQTDGQGDSVLTGPGVVIVESELYEISLVPVPADPYALLQRGQAEGRRSVLDFTKITEAEKAKTAAAAPATPSASEPASERGAPVPAPAPAAPTPETPKPTEASKPVERDLESLRRDVTAIAPPTLREFADGLLLDEGMTLELARKRLKDEWARRSVPVGTPEPKTGPKGEAQKPITDEDVARALTRK